MRKPEPYLKRILFVSFVLFCFASNSHNSTQGQIILTPEQMNEELLYVDDLIRRIHPDPYHAGSEAEFNALLNELSQEITVSMPAEEFYFILSRLTHYLKDGHTSLYNPNELLYLPARFHWADDGLVVICAEADCGLNFGDKILSMGGKTPVEVLKELQKIVSTENDFWLRSWSSRRLHCGSFLKHLNLVSDGTVSFIVEDIKGDPQQANVQLSPDPPPPDPQLNRTEYGWQVDEAHSLGIFYLDMCRNTAGYKNSLIGFFRRVKGLDIKRVVVDVRQNPGGDSNVVNQFFSFLPVRLGGWFYNTEESKVKRFLGDIRYSPEASQQCGYSQTIGYYRIDPVLRIQGAPMTVPFPPDSELIFYGNVFIFTASRTNSSANWFAVLVQDNKLGFVLGEPTGNKPSHFGYPLNFEMPYSKFFLTISHIIWYRPDYTKDAEDALYPDYYFPTTVQHIREGRDAQLEGLLSLFSDSSNSHRLEGGSK